MTHLQLVFLCLIGILSTKCFSTTGSKFNRVCYYTKWSGSGQGELTPDLVNTTLCTHIIFGFATIQNGSMIPSDPSDVEKYEAAVAMRKRDPKLKIMLTVGGGSGKNSEISLAVKDNEGRTRLATSMIGLISQYGFDGLDIDWEFPVYNSGPMEDKENFVLLLKEIRLLSNKLNSTFILSTAVAAPKIITDISYDAVGMAQFVDFINVMAYDFHAYQWYLPFTGHNSPLFNRSVEKAFFSTMNTAWAANNWIEMGMPRRKVMVGIPAYGYTFQLADPDLNGLDAPAIGGSQAWNFNQVCQFLAKGAKRVFDEESQVPYAFKERDWLAFDDVQSFTAKCNWVKEQGLGGMMTWNLNEDDWKSECGLEKFPLHTVIYNILH